MLLFLILTHHQHGRRDATCKLAISLYHEHILICTGKVPWKISASEYKFVFIYSKGRSPRRSYFPLAPSKIEGLSEKNKQTN